jgi:hypothetical protein
MVVIYKLTDDSVFSKIEDILRAIAVHSDSLTLGSGERPFEIHVPVFEDPAQDRVCRFRGKLARLRGFGGFNNRKSF